MTRIGIALSTETVCAVVVRKGNVIWHMTLQLPQPYDITTCHETIAAVISQVPRQSWQRMRVCVALDNIACQLKTIRGLPVTPHARPLAQILRTTPYQFFLSEEPLVTTGVRVLAPGVVTAAAFPKELIAYISAVCRSAGLRAWRYVPTTIAQASLSGNVIHHPCVAAIGAAMLNDREPLVYKPPILHSPQYYSRRKLVLAIVCGSGVLLGAFVPSLYALHVRSIALQRIAKLAPARAKSLQVLRDIDDIMSGVQEISAFDRHRLSKIIFLARLTDAMPKGSTVTMLKMDSSGVHMTAMAPHIADIVQDIQTIPGVSDVEILGSIAHESHLQGELERATLRFHVLMDQAFAKQIVDVPLDSLP